MSQTAKAQEPSMEEILASIRRIISDDEAKPAAAEAASPAPAPMAAPAPAPVKQPAAVVAPAPVKAAAAPAKAATPAVKPAPAATAAPAAEKNSQDDIDAMLASFDAPAAPVAAAPMVEDDNDDVFELTEQMATTAAPSFRKIEPHDDVEFSEPAVPAAKIVAAPIEPPRPAPAPRVEAPVAAQPVLSGATAMAVESAFNSLANTVLSNNSRTIEDLVKEMLRPMLKSWLDDNLPTMVERIVRAEIERVARGR